MNHEIGAFGDEHQNTAKLFAALSKAQSEFPAVPKDSKVTVTKAGATAPYASLDRIIECIRPALARNGLAFTQLVGGTGAEMTLTTVVSGHGAYISTTMPFQRVQNPQDMGKLVTYYKRYQLTAALGISADADADSDSVMENERKYAEPGTLPPSHEELLLGKLDAATTPDDLAGIWKALPRAQRTVKAIEAFKLRKEQLNEQAEETEAQQPERSDDGSGEGDGA